MGFISHFLAGGLFNRSEMNKKLDEISNLTEPAWKLIDTIDNTRGYSGEWTAPDVFGDGSPYDLGVYMIGGGGSGGACAASTGYADAVGGASGFGANIVIEKVTKNMVFPWVIGARGESQVATCTSSTNVGKSGLAGGTTSFNGFVAQGGAGGKAYASSASYNIYGAIGGQSSNDSGNYTTIPYGCAQPISRDYTVVSQSPRVGQNAFDSTMVSLSAGGSHMETAVVPMPDGTFGGHGSKTLNGVAGNATGYGNGGGAALSVKGSTASVATSGAGSDGVIFLYARKAVVE